MAKGDATATSGSKATPMGGSDNNISQLIMQMLQTPGMMQSLLPQLQRSSGIMGGGNRPMGMGQGNASGLSNFASQERGLGGGPMRGPMGQPFQPGYAGPSQAPMHNPMMMTDRMAPPPPSMMPTNNLLRPTSSPAPSGGANNFFQPNPASGGGQSYFQPRPSLPSAMPSQPVAQPMMQRPTMPTMNFSHYGNGGTF